MLVFDEPTAALSADDASRLFRGDPLLWPRRASPSIFVSHRYGEVLELCDCGHRAAQRAGRPRREHRRDDRRSVGRADARTTRRVGVHAHLARSSRGTRCPRGRRRALRTPGLAAALTVSVRRRRDRSPCTARWDPATPSWPASSAGTRGARRARSASAASRGVDRTLASRERRDRHRSRQPHGQRVVPRAEGAQQRQCRLGVEGTSRPLPADPVRPPRTRAGRHVLRAKSRSPRRALARAVRVLSGGNQQKVVLARWLMRDADVLLLVEPTQGVDVGARIDIYREIDALARDGVACLSCRATPRRWRHRRSGARVLPGRVVADLARRLDQRPQPPGRRARER